MADSEQMLRDSLGTVLMRDVIFMKYVQLLEHVVKKIKYFRLVHGKERVFVICYFNLVDSFPKYKENW